VPSRWGLSALAPSGTGSRGAVREARGIWRHGGVRNVVSASIQSLFCVRNWSRNQRQGETRGQGLPPSSASGRGRHGRTVVQGPLDRERGGGGGEDDFPGCVRLWRKRSGLTLPMPTAPRPDPARQRLTSGREDRCLGAAEAEETLAQTWRPCPREGRVARVQ